MSYRMAMKQYGSAIGWSFAAGVLIVSITIVVIVILCV